MRVGILTESYEPVQNGVATSVKTLVAELRRRNHHVCVLAPEHPSSGGDTTFVLRVPSMITTMNTDYPVPYPWFPIIRRNVGRLRLDLLHSQSPWFLGLLAVRMARKYRIPHISTYHTLYHEYTHYVKVLPGPATQLLLEWWMPEFYNQCAHVVVPSSLAETALRSYGVQSPITVIPTGVPLARPSATSAAARRAARTTFNIPQTAPLVLYVGRIAAEKNVELVIEAFAIIAERLPDAVLLIVGSGPNLTMCQELADAMPCADRILFTGAVPHDELASVYAAADLFMMGSVTETQGLVVGEARAAGLPCIVANAGGAGETVKTNVDGIVTDAKPYAFAVAAMDLLLHTERLQQMRESCLARAVEFTPAAMAERVLRVYNEVLPGVDSTGQPFEDPAVH